MALQISLIFMILGLVLLFLAALPISSRLNLLALGLACWLLALILAGAPYALR